MMKEIMKKKEYFAPSIQVIEMEHSCSIMQASGEKPKDWLPISFRKTYQEVQNGGKN